MQSFRLVRRVIRVTADDIRAVASFKEAPIYAGLEAMAQLAALHVRHCLDFKRHAFLLKIKYCDLPAQDRLDGDVDLGAKVISQSSRSFAYQTAALFGKRLALHAELLIGTRTYDRQFKKESLKHYYKGLFDDLNKPVDQTSHFTT